MAGITLTNNTSSDAVFVPCVFIDKYLPAANGEDVKVYLYMLRLISTPGMTLDPAASASALGLSEADLIHSLKYWAGEGIFKLSLLPDGSISALSLENPVQAGGSSQTAFSVLSSKSKPAKPEEIKPRSADTTIHLSQTEQAELDNDISFNIYMAGWQGYFPQPFTYADIERISYWYLRFDRNAEIMDYLIEYCAGRGHANTNYMNAVALAWHSSGYRTVDELRTFSKLRNDTSSAVMKAFGLYNQTPAPAQYEFIDRWINEYGFSRELIELACTRTIMRQSKPDFSYAEGILKKWKEAGVRTAAEVAAQDEIHNAQSKKAAVSKTQSTRTYHNFKERTDNNYTKMILERYSKKEA